jgi:hypothetical protein
MRKLTVLLALISISIANAQNWDNEKIKGNGVQSTITRSTESYQKIAASGSFTVELVSGKEGNITISGDENIINHIVTEVIGNELKIYFEKNKSYNYKQDITILVPFEQISEVSFTGSGKISTKDTIKNEEFELKFTGSGDANFNVETTKLIANKSGSGDVKISGITTNLEGKQAGSGNLNLFNLSSQNADVSVAGSGSIEVNCTNNLIAKVAGSGNIQYKGKPKTIDSNVAGSGDISGN